MPENPIAVAMSGGFARECPNTAALVDAVADAVAHPREIAPMAAAHA